MHKIRRAPCSTAARRAVGVSARSGNTQMPASSRSAGRGLIGVTDHARLHAVHELGQDRTVCQRIALRASASHDMKARNRRGQGVYAAHAKAHAGAHGQGQGRLLGGRSQGVDRHGGPGLLTVAGGRLDAALLGQLNAHVLLVTCESQRTHHTGGERAALGRAIAR